MLLPKQGVEGKQGRDFVSLGCSQGYYQSSYDETEQINFQALNLIRVEVGWGLFGELKERQSVPQGLMVTIPQCCHS